jgi:hypothetical protein
MMGDLEGTPVTPEQAAEAPPDGGQAFFSYTSDFDKKPYSFGSADELVKHLKTVDSDRMMRSDYTKKTQEIAEQRKQHEAERLRFDNDRAAHFKAVKEAEETIERARKYGNFLKANPTLRQKFEEELGRGMGPENISDIVQKTIDEKLKPIEEEREQERQRKAVEEERSAAIKNLKARFEDFDEEKIAEDFKNLAENNNIEYLLEILYHSGKGRIPKEEIEKQMADGMAKKKTAAMIPAGPGGASTGGGIKSFDEARRKYGDLNK